MLAREREKEEKTANKLILLIAIIITIEILFIVTMQTHHSSQSAFLRNAVNPSQSEIK